ncbi:G-D-S-L family lipolytic protein [Nostoc sp. FACHB-152]|uniref:SGNH/GDSL hydrolase family protein n=1 Tax=unclassified Nostoc TaxID=2593658 RepID=UPI001685CA45|nr:MULTISPECIES: SGNH/GDSL hydrolase family protein [unclassified Nostoc]MBD2446108.1 G-D-S-L family lipolytic protein [Nostoc sp. FACHB-152]MBD2467340.1 G-D-S-L family lipolytic protein [Nostoc sp. FACHB-145]
MRNNYLLTASLLTGLVIPASALTHLSNILAVSSSSLWHSQNNSFSTAQIKNSPNINKSSSEFSYQSLSALKAQSKFDLSVNISSSQFSGQVLQLVQNVQSRIDEKNILDSNESLPENIEQGFLVPSQSLFERSLQTPSLPLISGNQLYYQRLAALKTGQIYTRIYNDSQSASELSKKNQLTYEDWKNLLALEAKAVTKGQGHNYLSIMVGDSLSMWFPPEKLPSGKLWLNQGISGDTSGGILKRLKAFSATKPEVIYVMAGINDLRKGIDDEIILRNHRQIIRYLRQAHPNTQIFVQSILPTRLTKISNSRIRQINSQLAVIAQREGANYLNIHGWFTDSEGNLRLELTTDGLHLSHEGYDVWRSALEQVEFKATQRENERLRSQY